MKNVKKYAKKEQLGTVISALVRPSKCLALPFFFLSLRNVTYINLYGQHILHWGLSFSFLVE